MAQPPIFIPLNACDASLTAHIPADRLNTMNSNPVTIVDGVPGHVIIPTRLLDAYLAGTTSYPVTIRGPWQWLLGAVPFGFPFTMVMAGITLSDDLESMAVWDPVVPFGPPFIVTGLLPGIGQPLILQNAADFIGSLGIASSALNAGGAGYAPGNTFNVTGGGGTGGTGVVDTVFNGVFPIIALDQTGGGGTNFFTVAGDQTAHFTGGDSVVVAGSTGNDGTYTVVSATLVAGNTNIVTVQAIVDATADGTITSVDDGAVLTYHLTSSGIGYAVTTGAATTATSGTGDNNFTIDILTVGDGDGTLELLLDYRVVKAGL